MARILIFAFDISEAAQIRRIESLQSLGHDVASVSFRRANMNRDFTPDWPNLTLGRTGNARLAQRVVSLGVGLARLIRHRRIAGGRDVWIARNLDMLLLAFVFRWLTRRQDVRLAYECLDIHGLMTRDDMAGAVARWVERRLLRRVSLLIVSSPGFLRSYFEPVQGFAGQAVLIENKLWLGKEDVARPASPRRAEGPLVLGWVGSLRCAASLRLLEGVAREMGDGVRLVFRGSVHRHAVPDFDAIVARNANITYGGTYTYPRGLGEVYGGCDLVWSQDLWQAGGNSDWLLPNRIYEASYFGCPSIAVGTTETGRRVQADRLGFTVEKASADALLALLRGLTRDEIAAVAEGLLRRPDRAFRLTPEALEAALAPILFRAHRAPADGRVIPAGHRESLGG